MHNLISYVSLGILYVGEAEKVVGVEKVIERDYMRGGWGRWSVDRRSNDGVDYRGKVKGLETFAHKEQKKMLANEAEMLAEEEVEEMCDNL